MEKSIFLTGIGGQGMQSVGKEMIKAGDKLGFTVTYSPLYTFEKRGGLSSAYVVLSDKPEIGAPRKEKHDIIVTMDNGTYLASKDDVAPGGTLIVNSTLVKDTNNAPKDIKLIKVPFLDIATEVGNVKVLSTVVLGVVSVLCGLFNEHMDIVENIALETLKKKPELLELNRKAFRRGSELARKYL